MRSPLILCVEDDPNDEYFLQRAVSKAGVDLTLRFVHDGEEAIDYLAGTKLFEDRQAHPLPRLVLMDLKLPRKSGHEVLHWIRGQPLLRRLPVIILTSSVEPRDVNNAYDAGANSYVVKPSGVEALTAFVRALDQYWMAQHRHADLGLERPVGI